MASGSEYQKDFPFPLAYDFLRSHGLEEPAREIEISRDRYRSCRTSLKRAKIVVLVKEKGLYDQFLQEVWQSGRTDKGKSRAKSLVNIYRRWVAESTDVNDDLADDEETIEELEEARFERESELSEFLVKNLHTVEPGLRIIQREYVIPESGRRIDILCEDKDGTLVILELKVDRGHERVIGQAAFYQQMIKKLHPGSKVRVIIIAKELPEAVRIGALALSDVELFEYTLSMTLNRVSD